MPLPTFRRYVKSWRYERLPPDYRDSAPPKSGKVLALRIGVVVVFCAATFYVVTRIFLSLGPRAYNPLDDYQNINPSEITVDRHVQSSPSRRAVVSSLYSDGYAIAVAVLGHSTRSANVSARLLLPYLENQVSEKALCLTRAVGWEPYTVPLIPAPHGGKDIYPRFKDLYTKLNIWALDKKGIDSAVFLDADTLVRRNFDELFDSPFGFAAVPDVYGAGDAHGFRLTLNTGVMAFTPSSRVLESMRAALEVAVFPLGEADQAFLNLYFGGTCMRLPYIYNANLAIKARSPTLWARLKDEIRIVHYTLLKPFLHDANDSTDSVLALEEMERIMAQEAARYGGVYAEEFRWWKEAYEDMLDVKGHEIRACFKLQ
ncbi:glycosyltransferase family 8 protein [Mycena rebaudengoi]|nr:glycosyltransferase family 8 protein [Mycena rebaudengoi]